VSKWPGKYVIGLTGNIATGKSVVRRMLEHLGAYGIDADALSHRVITKGAPGYMSVVSIFGRWILDDDSQINRKKLGKMVFSDPEALVTLEGIIHPFVRQAIELLIRRASQRMIVIEAIKLFETNLGMSCDTRWITHAPETVQMGRLVTRRGMTEDEALKHIRIQNPQDEKRARADVIIENSGSFEKTWSQVHAAWSVISPIMDTSPTVVERAVKDALVVKRGRPSDSLEIANLVNRLGNGREHQSHEDVMEEFGDKAFLLLKKDDNLVGVAAWQVENLVSRTIEIQVDPQVDQPQALKTLLTEVEKSSRDLQCEASLLFLTNELSARTSIWKELGYEQRTSDSLGIQAWQDAVKESMPENTNLYFKQLRQDRILRPI
jgi:dephospho-CoA kinase